MAEKITIVKWRSDDGKDYETEIDALRADAKFWKEQFDRIKIYVPRPDQSFSSYGSSGGGGHD